MIDRDTILLLIGAAAPVYCIVFALLSMWFLKKSSAASRVALTAAFADTLHHLGSRRREQGETARSAAE